MKPQQAEGFGIRPVRFATVEAPEPWVRVSRSVSASPSGSLDAAGKARALRGLIAMTAALSLVGAVASSTSAEELVRFTDVTAEAGVGDLHWHGVPPEGVVHADLDMLFVSAGAVAADFDGDDWCDLYVTRIDAPNLLYINQQDGTFSEEAASRGVDTTTFSTGAAVADIDNDGDLDLMVLTTHPDRRNYLYLNDGTGSFTEASTERGVSGFAPDSVHHCTSAAFGDYDRDGHLDLMVAAWQPDGKKKRIYQNSGDGFFVDRTSAVNVDFRGIMGFAPMFADMTNDGWQDLVFVGDFGTSRFFRNTQLGIFKDETAERNLGTDENGMGNAVGDVDNDGDLDWFITSIHDENDTCDSSPCNWGSSGNRLYINDGEGVFTDGTDTYGVREGFWGWAASFFDYDNDGDLDIGMTNGVDFGAIPWDDPFNVDPIRLWRNEGPGKVMTEVSEELGMTDTGSGKGYLTFDYDRDGDLDVFLVNNAAFPVLYRNDGGNRNNWLQVRLVGQKTNRMGVGARVYVQTRPDGCEC